MLYKGPIVDGHLHVNSWYDLEGEDFYAGFDDIEKRRGVKALNIAAIPIGEWGPANNMLVALYKLHNPNVYIHGGIMYHEYPVRELPCGADPLSQYNELMEIGFDGVKILDTKAQYHNEIDNPVNLPFLSNCKRPSNAPSEITKVLPCVSAQHFTGVNTNSLS